jgi:hypothetical protein
MLLDHSLYALPHLFGELSYVGFGVHGEAAKDAQAVSGFTDL